MSLNTQKRLQGQDDEFLKTINKIFSIARFIGISKCNFRISFLWSVSLFLILLAIVLGSIWKLVRLFSGMSLNHSGGRKHLLLDTNCIDKTSNFSARTLYICTMSMLTILMRFSAAERKRYKHQRTNFPIISLGFYRGFVGRLSGSVFYGNALVSLILSIRFVSSWAALSVAWFKANSESGLNLPPDKNIRRRLIFVTSFISTFACVEHVMSMVSATGFDIQPEEYFNRYIISSHGFLIQSHEYTLWLAVPIFIISKVATLQWNFQDLLIILISMGLASRYHRLNMYLNCVVRYERRYKDVQKLGTDSYIQIQVWRKLREAYVRQSVLVEQFNEKLGALILLSNINNLYFICLQLFFGLGSERGSLINRAYYFFSLGWLMFRACSVVLAASDVHVHSKRALPSLHSCPGSGYNIEIKRLITQLAHHNVSLTGLGLFSLQRNLLLQVAATILKYELVLLQYDYN